MYAFRILVAVALLCAAAAAGAQEPPDDRIWVPGIEEPGLVIEVIEVADQTATDETVIETIDKTSIDDVVAPAPRAITLPRPQFTPAVIYFLPGLGTGVPWIDTNRAFRLEPIVYRLPDEHRSYYEFEFTDGTVLAYGIVDIPELSGAAYRRPGSIPARSIDPQERAIAGVHLSLRFGGFGTRNSPV